MYLSIPGQYYDSETGLHYNWHRYYDPATGRYLTPDPIGLAGGINLYSYVANDPINFIDPWGLESFPFQGYVPPIAVTGTVDSSGNFTMTGAEAVNPGTFPGAANPTARNVFNTSVAIGFGAIVAAETGSVQAGKWTAWGVGAFLSLADDGSISEPPFLPGTGIDWYNPPSLNEPGVCNK